MSTVDHLVQNRSWTELRHVVRYFFVFVLQGLYLVFFTWWFKPVIRTLKRARRSQNNLGCNGGKKGLSWKILLSVHLSPIVLVQQILWQNSWPDLPASVKLDMKSQARISELMLIIQKKSSPFLSSRAFLFFVHKHYESAHFACTLGICVLAFQLHRLHFYTVWPIVATTKNGRCRGGCSVHTVDHT